tara:strand:+ start:2167 stop:4506 length:2340 start_codon:yes stop_codon:yes gene_type:complete
MSKKQGFSSFKEHGLIVESWREYLQAEEVEPTVWLQMVKENYEAILKEDPLNEELLTEGVWSKIKYYAGKMGSMEKGGKVFGGRKKRIAAAEEKLSAAIEQAATKGFGDFRTQLEKDFPEFPNMEEAVDFQSALYNIGEIYDSIDAAVAKYDAQGAEVKGGLDPSSANAFVSALRQYVEHLLDFKLADSYKHFTESEEKEQDRVDEAPPPVGGVARVGAAPRRPKTGGPATAGWAPEDPNAPKDSKYTKRAADGEAVDSETIKGLESNILPLLLGLTGLAGVAIGLLLKTPWALEAFKSVQGIKDSGSVTKTAMQTNKAFKAVQTTIAPKSGEGFTQMFGRIAGGNPATFGPDSPPTEMFSAMSKLGIDPKNPKELFELGCDPAAYNAAVSGNAGTIGEMFPASNQNLWLDKGTEAVATAQEEVTTQIAKTTTKTLGGGAGAVAAGQLAAASTLATTLGIGLIAAGAAVKLIRMKGLKSSRAQMLQDLSKELQPFPGAIVGPEEPPPIECPDGQVPDPEDPTKCLAEPKPLPPKISVKKPAIAVLDDDTVSIFRIRWRKQDKVDAQRDIYSAAQQATIVGRDSDPTSDQVADPSSEYRPFKANKKSFAQIKKKAAGKSGEEPLFAIDASIVTDLGNKSGKSQGAGIRRAGIGKARAEKLTRQLFKVMLRYERKPTLKMVDSVMKRLKIDDPKQQELVRAQLVAYGLLEPSAANQKPKKKSEKGTGKKATAALQENNTRSKKWKISIRGKNIDLKETKNKKQKWKILKDGSVIQVLNEKK